MSRTAAALPDAPWRRRTGMNALLAALDAPDGATRFVGGAVRDGLLGLDVSDIDCATRLTPEEARDRIVAAGFKSVPTGIAHGTVTAILPDGPVEVTTLRRDVSTDGRRATVAFTDDWGEDAARRDFTINALSADPLTGAVHDYFNGLDDLAVGRVRFIGEPLARIAEDHLRILRFFRFHARFGRGEPDAAGFAACVARANDLMALSRERIAGEMLKLLALPDPAGAVELMASAGVLRPVLPEIGGDEVGVLARLIARERAAGIAADPLRRLAALLPADPDVAGAVAARLKLSKAAQKRLTSAARRDGDEAVDPRPLAYRLGIEGARDQMLLLDADPSRAIAALNGWPIPRFPLKGGDLIALGLSPGPAVAAALRAIEDVWVAEDFPPEARLREIAAARIAQPLRSR